MPLRPLRASRLTLLAIVALPGACFAGCSATDPAQTPSGSAGASAAAGAAGAPKSNAGGAQSSAGAAGALGGAGPGGASGGAASTGGSDGNAGSGSGSAGSGSAGASGIGGTAAGGSGAAGNGGSASRINGSIVPLYSYPSDDSWQAIIAAKQAHPSVRVIAIVNPDSGPGAQVDAQFTSGIAALVKTEIVAIGYVSTAYTKRGQPAVKADVDKWRAAYPAVQGIFFDEQSNQAGDEQFYRDVSSYAKAKGFALTVGNPGTGVPDSYLGSVDIMLSYESAGAPPLATLSQYAAHRSEFAIIPYAAKFDAGYAKAALDSVAYVYLTSDDLPNPWDTLPSFFGELLGALEP